MPDDKSKRGPADPNRVNVNEDWELTYWSKEFGCPRHQLRAAVKAVGTKVEKVRAHLKRKAVRTSVEKVLVYLKRKRAGRTTRWRSERAAMRPPSN